MHEFSCLIVEDEKLGQDILTRKLVQYFPGCKVAGIADSVKTAIDFLKVKKPDIIFMDVQIKGGTGFDVLAEFPERSFNIIFLTAYSHYAIEALNKSASYYLLKPIDDDEFCKGVGRLAEDIRKMNEYEFFSVNTDGDRRQIRHDEIMYFEASGNYTFVHLKDEKIIISKNIGSLEAVLPTQRYIRCHASYLLNLSNASQVLPSSVILKNGDMIPVSRRKKNEVDKIIATFRDQLPRE
jgi:two-component system, LytTR family, response regulator